MHYSGDKNLVIAFYEGKKVNLQPFCGLKSKADCFLGRKSLSVHMFGLPSGDLPFPYQGANLFTRFTA